MGEVVSPGRAAEDKRPPASSNPPDGCSMEVYGRYTTLMHKCWRNEPSVRPSFDEVHRELTALCTLTQHENKAAEERQVSQSRVVAGWLSAAHTAFIHTNRVMLASADASLWQCRTQAGCCCYAAPAGLKSRRAPYSTPALIKAKWSCLPEQAFM
jgi:hypothetical protein